MKKSRFTESQVIGVLKQVDAGQRVEDASREHGNLLQLEGKVRRYDTEIVNLLNRHKRFRYESL